MSAGSEPQQVARLELPAPGGGCGVVALACFLSFFTGLAVYHLATISHPLPIGAVGVVAAVLWLALMAVGFGSTLFVLGPWGSLVACLGEFSRRHFVETARDGDRIRIGFGFELFGRTFCYLRIERGQVASVVMDTGQATALAGRDMNDWSVVLWYRHPRRHLRRRPLPNFRDGEEVYIVGPCGPKQQTAQSFAAFVEFLRAAGVELRPGEKEYEFRAAAEVPPAPGSATDLPPQESRG
jgi:hypothetical protein